MPQRKKTSWKDKLKLAAKALALLAAVLLAVWYFSIAMEEKPLAVPTKKAGPVADWGIVSDSPLRR